MFAFATKPTGDRVEIRADQSLARVEFIIDGQPVAFLTADGLHVRGNVSYGGSLTDYGPSGFEEIAGNGKAAADAP